MHGLKKIDEDLLMLFRRYAIPHQVVLSKVDKFIFKNKKQAKGGVAPDNIAKLQKTLHDLKPLVQPDGRLQGPGALGEIVTCSGETSVGPGQKLGVNALRWAIISAAGLDGNVEARREIIPQGESAEGSTQVAP